MNKNMGMIDRSIRVLLALIVPILFLKGVISGVLARILGVLATVFVLSSVVGFCPIYIPLKLSTRKSKSD